MGMGRADVERYGFVVTDGNAAPGQTRPSAAGHAAAIIRVQVRNAKTSAYRSKDPATGANAARLNPRTGKPWGAEDPCVLFPDVNPNCTDDGRLGSGRAAGLLFGGALPWEANNLSFTAMAASESWQITPALADIQAVMREVGPRRTVLAIYFRNPYVLDDASGLKEAGAIVAGFGVSDTALLEVVSGRFRPVGKLPFALPRTLQAVIDNEPDVPGYPAADTLYPFGYGLSYRVTASAGSGALPSPPAGPRPWRVASRRRRRRASCQIRDVGRPTAVARRRRVRARVPARAR
jgi:beta-glucosidase